VKPGKTNFESRIYGKTVRLTNKWRNGQTFNARNKGESRAWCN